jgi:hypothetical protein
LTSATSNSAGVGAGWAKAAHQTKTSRLKRAVIEQGKAMLLHSFSAGLPGESTKFAVSMNAVSQ